MIKLTVLGYRPRMAIILLVGSLLGLLFAPAMTARALPPGAPQPAAIFEQGPGLGVTGPYNIPSSSYLPKPAHINGIMLRVSSQGIFYFYLQPISTNWLTVNLHADQRFSSYLPVLRLYDSYKNEIKADGNGKPVEYNLDCREYAQCTATLQVFGLPKGAYTLRIELPTSPLKPYDAWLTSNMVPTTGLGLSTSTAWPWLNRQTLYGQIPAATSNHYYIANLLSGTTYTLQLWGSPGSNLNVYVYAGSDTSRAMASSTAATYPETVSFTVPARDYYVFVRVENASKTDAEYFLLHTP